MWQNRCVAFVRIVRTMALLVPMMVAARWASGDWLTIADGSRDPAPPTIDVRACDERGLDLTIAIHGIDAHAHELEGVRFTELSWPGAAPSGAFGEPLVPVIRRLILVPDRAEVDIEIDAVDPVVLNLAQRGYDDRLVPVQRSVPDRPERRALHALAFDDHAYASDATPRIPAASVTELGIMRGWRVHLLEIRPVEYNAARHLLIAWPQIDLNLRFVGGRRSIGRPLPWRLEGMLLNPPSQPAGDRTGGNYLIILPELFETAIQPFIDAKTADGFNVMTHVISPGTTKEQIKAYIESLWLTAEAPDYLLLVGRSDSVPVWTGGGDSHAATDLPYACMDGPGDWIPDIAIGRFCVRSTDQLATVIEKTRHVAEGFFEDPTYIKRVMLLAGTDSGCGDHATHNWVIDTHLEPNEYNTIKVWERLGGDTQDVLDTINAGIVIGVYYGHSNWQHLYNGPSITQDNVRSLSNDGMYPLFLAFSCNNTRFTYSSDCIGETFFIEPNKGASVVIGTSYYIYWSGNPGWPETSNSEKFFFDTIFIDEVTEASLVWQGAMARLLAFYGPDNPAPRDYAEMFNLLGDPSLQIPMHATPGFAIDSEPAENVICAGEDAVYTLSLESFLEYDEPVTLSLEGQPTGTTTQFSVNPIVPPGETVLTIGNTADAPPGAYEMTLRGVGATFEDEIDLGLHISTDIPEIVTLATPIDGAVDQPLSPTLTWEPASQAASYDVEIALTPSFEGIVYTAAVEGTSHEVGVMLDSDTIHYWRVRAQNGCGLSSWSAPFSFRTLVQPIYFTEEFPQSEGNFDLEYTTVRFVPDGSGDFYDMCGGEIDAFPTDPAGGSSITIEDDGSRILYPDQPIFLYGESYDAFAVNANGNVTFGAGDSTYTESLEVHFNRPRISIIFDDFNPAAGGQVSWKQTSDRIAVTWLDVPEYGTSNHNYFQLELLFNGEIHFSYLGIDSGDSIVGLSEGQGIPPLFIESDLSGELPCCPADLTGDATVNVFDLLDLLDAWGQADVPQDLNADGVVNVFDLLILLEAWGPCW